MASPDVLLKTDLPIPLFIRGKVRDTYDLGVYLLIVATDRISAFDVVLSAGIPAKGKVLNQLSAFWFQETTNIVPNHVIDVINDLHHLDPYFGAPYRFHYPTYLAGRTMMVKKLERIPVECVVRGYLAGSAWEEYRKSGKVNGIALPKGLRESQELPEPIFTPTTKAETGHDQPLTMTEMQNMVGKQRADEMSAKTVEVYKFARKYALTKGIIIADTKMEFGLEYDKLTLIDELLTPDSSRFWDADRYKVGQSQPSYDKQPVRDWLVESGWNKEPPAPALPPEVVEATSTRYIEAYERLTGKKLVSG